MSIEFDNKIKKLKETFENEDPSAQKVIQDFEERMTTAIKKSGYSQLEVTVSIRNELKRRIIAISKALSLVRELKDTTRDMLFAKREAYLEIIKLFPEGDYQDEITAIEKAVDHELEVI